MNPNPRIRVGVLGATGSVGQKFVERLADHPWFELTALAASARSAGQRYGDVVAWRGASPLDAAVAERVIEPCEPGLDCSIVFSALDASVAGAVETAFAESGYVVISNAKSHRMAPDVPLVIPEVNADHVALVERQRFGKGDGPRAHQRGALVTNPNCAVVGLAIALKPLVDVFGVDAVSVVTLQALSGAGYPGVPSLDAIDNVVPFIGGEEDKVETEPQKILGRIGADGVVPHPTRVSATCTRVPVTDGHLACVSVKLDRLATAEEIIESWETYRAPEPVADLPSAPARLIEYSREDAAPQPRLHRDTAGGMAVTIGRLRPCPTLDWKFVLLVHNTVRGAAGAAILNAELMTTRE